MRMEYRYTGRHLTQVPTDIPAVSLTWNDITDIRPGAFSHLSQCTQLDLDMNELSYIRADMWIGLGSLDILYLNENNRETIESGTFASLAKLTRLILEDTSLA